MITAEEFLLDYDDFSSIDLAKIQANLDFCARNYCKGKVWGSKRKDAIMLRAAHRGAMLWLQTAQMAQAASSISSGGSPFNPTPADDELKLTTYGRQFLELRASLLITGFSA